MSKIMLVEDDNNLREIYEARLLAEGYEIVSAKDGEEALAMAIKEKPDLIISDVMMPKISGFDMLDILRSTAETKETKVIMMTALSQAEDKARAEKLGADRYLVKSQVTLEDVAKVAHEVLTGEESRAESANPMIPDYNANTPSTPPIIPAPVLPQNTPLPEISSPPATPAPAATVDTEPVVSIPSSDPLPPPQAVTPPSPEPQQGVVSAPDVDKTPQPVVEPIQSVPIPAPIASSQTVTGGIPASQTTAEESASIENQIDQFIQQMPADIPEPPQAIIETPKPPEAIDSTSLESETDATQSLMNNQSSMVEHINVVAPPPDEPVDPNKLADTVNTILQPQTITETPPPSAPSSPSGSMTGTAIKSVSNAATPPPVAPEETVATSDVITEQNQSNSNPTNDNVSIAHKKVIEPIGDPTKGPDLNALLAKEEAQNQSNLGGIPVSQFHIPGTPTPNPDQPIDPNSIAL
ncbi:MAG: hypothetical protein NVSMB46_07790 [Candidatus Saccharimonadales bacterium]